jgi:hypothetical protein
MTSGLPQQAAVASRVGRLVERALALAIDERDDDLAVARLTWLAQDDQAALDQAGEVCLARAEADLVVRGRAAGLLARVAHHDLAVRPAGTRRRPLSMRTQAIVSYGERSAVQAGFGGRADLEGGTVRMSTEVGDLDAALAALYQLPLEQFVGHAASSSRILGSTASTIDPPAGRSYRGGPSAPSARFTVFLEHPITLAICLIGICSPRCSRRISAQSSTLNTSLPPRLDSSQGLRGVNFQASSGVSSHAPSTAHSLLVSLWAPTWSGIGQRVCPI